MCMIDNTHKHQSVVLACATVDLPDKVLEQTKLQIRSVYWSVSREKMPTRYSVLSTHFSGSRTEGLATVPAVSGTAGAAMRLTSDWRVEMRWPMVVVCGENVEEGGEEEGGYIYCRARLIWTFVIGT